MRPLLCLLAVLLSAGEVPTGLALPESIVEDRASGRIYCSNVGAGAATPAAVTAKDGDGFISVLHRDGTVDELRHLPAAGDPALHGPKGLAVDGALLYVADIDRIVVYDVLSRRQVQAFDLTAAKVGFANDLAIVVGTLLLSDTTGDRVLRIDRDREGRITGAGTLVDGLVGANGIVGTGGKDLAVAGFPFSPERRGGVQRIPDLGAAPARALPFPAGLWDGIAIADDDTLYVTDWTSGALWKQQGDAPATKLVDGLQGPADLCLLGDGSALLIPEMQAARVRVVPLPPLAR